MLTPVVGALLGTGGRNLGADLGLAAMAVEMRPVSANDDTLSAHAQIYQDPDAQN